jgi:uncharacterized protein
MRLFSIILFLSLVPYGFASAGTITVSGQGAATAEPDMATISMGVAHNGKTAQEAMDTVGQKINAMLSALKESGVGAKDVQTSQISLYPMWSEPDRNNQTHVIGFSANVTLSVILRDIDKVGVVLSEVVRVGGNNFHGVNLGIQDTSVLEAEARALAVKDALAKAGQLADAAGVQVVEIISIAEGGSQSYPSARMAEYAMASDSMQIARGETSVNQSVTIVVEID